MYKIKRYNKFEDIIEFKLCYYFIYKQYIIIKFIFINYLI
jgi:hypothetical protein